MLTDECCLTRFDGVPAGGGGGEPGPNADGLFINSNWNSSGATYFLPLAVLATSGSSAISNGYSYLLPQAGTIDVDVRVVTTANAGLTSIRLFFNGVGGDTDGPTVLNLGVPGVLYTFTDQVVAQYDQIGFQLSLISNLGTGAAAIVIRYQ